jgi:maltose-binding protein MalE
MKLLYRTNIYEGPETMEEIVKLSKRLYKKGWATKIYDPAKSHTYGPPLEGISGEIFGLGWVTHDGTKIFSEKLGTITPGRIETHDWNKSLEKFLRDYQFKKFEKVDEIK